jgi:hypothetical protein
MVAGMDTLTGFMDGLGVSTETLGKVVESVFGGLIAVTAVRAVMLLARSFIFLGAILLANPLGLIVLALGAVITGVILFKDQIQQTFGVDVMAILKETANFLIGSFVAAFHDISFVITNFPKLLDAAMETAVNFFVRGLNSMLQFAEDGVNDFADLVSKLSLGKINLGHIDIKPFEELSGAYAAVADDIAAEGKRVQDDLNRDYIGPLVKIATKSGAASKALDEFLKGTKNTTPTDPKLAKKYADIVRTSKDFIEQQQLEAKLLGVNTREADAYRNELDLLNKAAKDNINLTPQQKAELHKLAVEMANAKYQTDELTKQFNFAKDAFSGFVHDIRTGLQQGESLWKAFGNAVLNVLNKIIDKLEGQFVDALFNSQKVGGGGGFGGFLSGIFGMFTGGGLGGGAVGAATGAPMALIGSQLHGGGIAGSGGSARQIDPRAMLGAPRMHSGGIAGLAPNEVPAILKRGEPVGEGYTNGGGDMNLSVHLNVDATGASPGEGKNIVQQLSKFIDSPNFKSKIYNVVTEGMSRRYIKAHT